MHVGLDLLFLVPDQTGGRETYAQAIFGRLRKLRPDWRLTGFVAREAAGDGWWRDACDDVVVLGAASGRARARWAAGELAMLPRAAARAGVDVLHAPANFGPVSGSFARVVTLHDVIWLRVPQAASAPARILTTAMVKPAVRRAHRVLTPSRATREDAIRLLGVAPERVTVVPNGHDPSPCAADAAAGRAFAGVADDVPIVLCIASHVGHKNLPALVAAVTGMPPRERPALVLAGHRTDALAGPVGVHALGRVSEATLKDLYAAAAAVVLPTRYEGFGLPVIEALARGVAVACSDVPPLREVAGEAALFFDPGDPAAIAAAIGELLGAGADVQRRRELGRERAAAFSWDVAAEMVVAAYEQAAPLTRLTA